MPAAATLNSSTTEVWRARALTRFRAVSWNEAVGLMLISAAFAQLASDNDFYPNGKILDMVQPSYSALSLMREAESSLHAQPSGIALKAGAPTAARLKRQYPERLGFLQMLNGDHVAAFASYKSALAAADDERGVRRCRLALALLDYLERDDGTSAPTVTAELAARARTPGPSATDIVAAAERNVTVMRGGGVDVFSYERL
jgi:hypothetical protein